MSNAEHRSTSTPANGRFRAVWIGKNEWIAVPAARNWLFLIFYIFWLFFWVLGGFMAIYMLFNGQEQLFIALWLVGWALGVIFASTTIAWQLDGRYRITIIDEALVYGWSMPFVSHEKRFDLMEIRQLEAVRNFHWPIFGKINTRSYNPPIFPWTLSLTAPKSLKFVYADQTIYLPLGLGEDESEALLDWLRPRASAALGSIIG